MGKNLIIEALKVISLPFVPFIMLWVKLYSMVAYMITGVAHILTFGHYPVSRNPLLVLFAIPLIQIILFPSMVIMLFKGIPSTEAIGKAVNENVFSKYERNDSLYNYDALVLE